MIPSPSVCFNGRIMKHKTMNDLRSKKFDKSVINNESKVKSNFKPNKNQLFTINGTIRTDQADNILRNTTDVHNLKILNEVRMNLDMQKLINSDRGTIINKVKLFNDEQPIVHASQRTELNLDSKIISVLYSKPGSSQASDVRSSKMSNKMNPVYDSATVVYNTKEHTCVQNTPNKEKTNYVRSSQNEAQSVFEVFNDHESNTSNFPNFFDKLNKASMLKTFKSNIRGKKLSECRGEIKDSVWNRTSTCNSEDKNNSIANESENDLPQVELTPTKTFKMFKNSISSEKYFATTLSIDPKTFDENVSLKQIPMETRDFE